MIYTYCKDCDNVTADSRKQRPIYWLCIKFPNYEGHGFVDPGVWIDDPYMRCKGINGGQCPCFTPRRTAPNHKGTDNEAL